MRGREKQFLITTEKHEVTIIRNMGRSAETDFCAQCGDNVEIMRFDDAAGYAGFGGRELVRRIESGIVHSIETFAGDLAICKPSLEKEK